MLLHEFVHSFPRSCRLIRDQPDVADGDYIEITRETKDSKQSIGAQMNLSMSCVTVEKPEQLHACLASVVEGQKHLRYETPGRVALTFQQVRVADHPFRSRRRGARVESLIPVT